MRVFWAVGYDAASIPMLTAAMGISAQSLYAAFGSKDDLYRQAIDFYSRTIGGFAARALAEEPNAVEGVARLLKEAAWIFASTDGIPGCMITMAPAELDATPLTILGRELRAASVSRLTERLLQGVNDGQLPLDFPCKDWAIYISSVVQGMSVQARDGASVQALLAIASIAADAIEKYRQI